MKPKNLGRITYDMLIEDFPSFNQTLNTSIIKVN